MGNFLLLCGTIIVGGLCWVAHSNKVTKFVYKKIKYSNISKEEGNEPQSSSMKLPDDDTIVSEKEI